MNWKRVNIGSFLSRVKQPVEIQSSIEYKRITIKTKHQGVFLRDELKGSLIGTKLQFVVAKGQFILSKIDARLGAFGIVPEKLDGAIITGNFWVFDVDETKLNIDWFNLFISSGNFYDICNQASSGTTHRKYLDEDKFMNFEIDLPELYEQDAFMNKYERYYVSYQSIHAEIVHQQTYLQLLRQTILQEAVQGKLTKQNPTDEPATVVLKRIKAEKEKLIKAGKLKKEKELPPITKDEIPFILPAGWACCRLHDIAIVGTGATPLTTRKDYYKGHIPWITSSATGSLFVTEAEKHISEKALKETNCKVYPVETLIVAMYGQGKTRGQITELSIEAATNQACAAIEIILKEKNHKDYIKYFFRKIYIEIRELAEGGAQPNLNLQKIKNTLIPLPPLAEQKRIVHKVQKLQQQLSQLEAQVQQSRQYAQQLLQSVLKVAFQQKINIYEVEGEMSHE